MLDFNSQKQQRQRNYGPVPAGSKVLCSINLERPKFASREHEYVSETKGGLLGLWVKLTVIAGTYEGVSWYENLWLPVEMQHISLSEGQTIACELAGEKIRAIIEAHRNVMPNDESPQAARKRSLPDWLDINGMEFPARLGINKEPYENNGKTYWNNTLGFVLTPDQKEYAELMNGSEIITDGPVVGEGGKQQGQRQYQRQQQPYSENGDFGAPFPSAADNMDLVPF